MLAHILLAVALLAVGFVVGYLVRRSNPSDPKMGI